MNPVLALIAWLVFKPKKKTTKPYPEGLITASAKKAWKDVFSQRRFKNMYSLGVYAVRNIQGTSVPSEHSCGNAIDFGGSPEEMMNLALYLQKNAKRLNVNYVIHNGQVSKQGGAWKKYTGSNSHKTHVHVDFLPKCVN